MKCLDTAFVGLALRHPKPNRPSSRWLQLGYCAALETTSKAFIQLGYVFLDSRRAFGGASVTQYP